MQFEIHLTVNHGQFNVFFVSFYEMFTLIATFT